MQQHQDSGADVTLATILIDPKRLRFGVVDIDSKGRITGFEEKPKETKTRSPYNPAWSRDRWACTSSTPMC